MTFSFHDAGVHHRAWTRFRSRRVIDANFIQPLVREHVTSLPSWIHHSTSSTARMTTANTSSATRRIPSTKSSSRQSSVSEPSWPSACVFRQYRIESCSLTRLSDTASSMARTLCRPQKAEERGRNVTGPSKLAIRMDPDVMEYHREAGAGSIRLGCFCGTLEWMQSCHAYMLTTSF